MKLTSFSKVKNSDLHKITGGQQMKQLIIGGRVVGSYPVFNDPWQWAVDAAGEFVKRNRRR